MSWKNVLKGHGTGNEGARNYGRTYSYYNPMADYKPVMPPGIPKDYWTEPFAKLYNEKLGEVSKEEIEGGEAWHKLADHYFPIFMRLGYGTKKDERAAEAAYEIAKKEIQAAHDKLYEYITVRVNNANPAGWM